MAVDTPVTAAEDADEKLLAAIEKMVEAWGIRDGRI